MVAKGRRCTAMPKGFVTSCEEKLWRLSLMESSAASPSRAPKSEATRQVIPVELDLISKVHVPNVIKPRPVRPRWTTICIDSSNIVAGGAAAVPVSQKTTKEVETELELPGALPAIVSGNHNRVYLANDAYKAMVGQPVCPWLDSMPDAGASRRINGIVVLHVPTFNPAASSLMDAGVTAFPYTARISWELDGSDTIACLTVPCAVEHLAGNSSDYRFIWRFDSSKQSLIYNIV